MAKRRKSDGGGGQPEDGAEPGSDQIAGAEGLDNAPLDDVPTRPGVAIGELEGEPEQEKTDPGADVGDFAATLEPPEVPRRNTEPGLDAFEDPQDPTDAISIDDDEVTSAGRPDPTASEPTSEPIEGDDTPSEGARILDFSSGRADHGAVPDDAAGASGDGDAGDEGGEDEERVPFEQLEPLIEALLLASDKPLSVADIKRLSGESDARLINQALDALIERRKGGGIQIISVAGAFSLRTNPQFAGWVSKLVAGKPVRLSRAMLETLSIVAYRQPITRPEIDDIRGVDCGPVLKTLLDRNLVRVIGKKEEVGRPMLYGTTSEFLRIFSLKDLTQLPTLRQFHELSAEHQAKVDEDHPAAVDATVGVIGGGAPIEALSTAAINPDPGEDDRLIADLEEASEAASRAAGPLSPEPPPEAAESNSETSRSGS